MAVEIATIVDRFPPDFDILRLEACTEGFRQIERLWADWQTGTTRFDRVGEALLTARVDNMLAGVGGITFDPALPTAFRMRRFYVRPAYRRAGIGREMVAALLMGVAPSSLITVNAAPASVPFWESMGFRPDPRDGHTHILR